METLDDMTDKAFLGYCALHSQTERALFRWTDVARLYLLAGKEFELKFPFQGEKGVFWNMYEDEALPLIKVARERLRQPSPQDQASDDWEGPIFPPKGC